MNSYIISLIVTAEQENAIIDLYTDKCWAYLKTDFPETRCGLSNLHRQSSEYQQLKSSDAIFRGPPRTIASEQNNASTVHSDNGQNKETSKGKETSVPSHVSDKNTSDLIVAIKTEATLDDNNDADKLKNEEKEDSSSSTRIMMQESDYQLVKCETECLYSSEDEENYMERDINASSVGVSDNIIREKFNSKNYNQNDLCQKKKTIVKNNHKVNMNLLKSHRKTKSVVPKDENVLSTMPQMHTLCEEDLHESVKAQNTEIDNCKEDDAVDASKKGSIVINSCKRKIKIDCKECKTTFHTRKAYKSHKNKDDTCKSWHCKICNQIFHSGTKNFNVHLRTHDGQYNYQCKCKKKFANKRYLRRHLARCNFVDNSFKCDSCPFCCKEEYILHVHKLRHHNVDGKFPCYKCPKEFAFLHTLSEHLLCNHRLGNLKDVPCSICGKLMLSRYLKRHETTHKEIKEHKCELCPDAFKTRAGLKSHMNKHTCVRDYYCETCGKGFTTVTKLTLHLRVHTGEKPEKCPICDFRCALKGNLIKHMRVHQK